MERLRLCHRPACAAPAVATLAYQYASRTVWLDDLGEADPHTMDLCATHADGLSAPRGWTCHDRRTPPAVATPVAS